MRTVVPYLIVIFFLVSLPAESAPQSNHAGKSLETPSSELSATEREGIQAASYGVLMSRRNYSRTPVPAVETLKTQVKETRQMIEQLVAPSASVLQPSSSIGSNKSKAQVQTKPDDEGTAWRTHNANQLVRSKQKLAAVRKHIEAKRKAADQDQISRYAQIPFDLSERLAAIEKEVDVAAALPVDQRQEKLRKLAASLNFEQTPFGQRGGVADPDMPTISTRSGHRIQPSAAMDDKPTKSTHRK